MDEAPPSAASATGDHRESSGIVGRWFVVGAGLLLLLARLWNVRSAPFISDEPLFLDASRSQLESGAWLAASPFEGTEGVSYGPSVYWFYSVVQWVFGYDPLIPVVMMCALTTATQTWLTASLARLVAGGRLAFVLLLAFVASSPYLWWWSRLAWDQTVLVCAAAAVALLCRSSTLSTLSALGVGGLIGISVSSHLMVLPFAMAVVVTLVWEHWRTPWAACRTAATIAGAAIAVNLPYLYHLLTTLSESPDGPEPDLGRFPVKFLQTLTVATASGIEYFFQSGWTDFVRSSPGLSIALDLRGVLLVIVAALALGGLLTGWSSRDIRRRRLARCALLSWAASPALYALQGVGDHPHYQFAIWWVVPAGIALGLDGIPRIPMPAQRLRTVVGAVIAVNALILGHVVAYAADHSGIRGAFTSLDAQRAVVDELCALPARPTRVSNETDVFAESLEYLVSITPACGDRVVAFCQAECESPVTGEQLVRLVYRGERSAALALAQVEGQRSSADQRLAGDRGHSGFHSPRRAARPGRSPCSRSSREAPPPVLM